MKLLCLFGHDIEVVGFQTIDQEQASWAKEYAAYQSGEGVKPPPPPSPRPIPPDSGGVTDEGDVPGIQYRRCSRCEYRDAHRIYPRSPLTPREQWERDGALPSPSQPPSQPKIRQGDRKAALRRRGLRR